MKICCRCGAEKPADTEHFYRNRHRSDGLDETCSECKRLAAKKWYRENLTKARAAVRKYARTHKQQLAANYRAHILGKKYGLSVQDYDALVEAQQGLCAICGGHLSTFNQRLAVDHCHTTGRIRGLLCHNCNTGLGKFKEDIELLLRAVEYLQRNRDQQ
jgi:hypothetical protein